MGGRPLAKSFKGPVLREASGARGVAGRLGGIVPPARGHPAGFAVLLQSYIGFNIM